MVFLFVREGVTIDITLNLLEFRLNINTLTHAGGLASYCFSNTGP